MSYKDINEVVNILNNKFHILEIKLLKMTTNEDVHLTTYLFEAKINNKIKSFVDIDYDKVEDFNSVDYEYFHSIILNKVSKCL